MRPAGAFPTDPAQARSIQETLARQVRLEALTGTVASVAGVDAAFTADRVVAVAVRLDYPDLTVQEESAVARPLVLPYVPGLLSFREGPAVLAALAGLARTPDLILCDGQGIAHPRRLGIAAHMGVLLDRPAIGVAKSRLTGEANGEALGETAGSRVPLIDAGELIGAVVRTRTRVRPIYVSAGHRITTDEAVAWTLACGRGYRLPEPTRLADKAADRYKRKPEELQG